MHYQQIIISAHFKFAFPGNILYTVERKTLTVEKSDEMWWMKYVRKFDKQNFDELS